MAFVFFDDGGQSRRDIAGSAFRHLAYYSLGLADQGRGGT